MITMYLFIPILPYSLLVSSISTIGSSSCGGLSIWCLTLLQELWQSTYFYQSVSSVASKISTLEDIKMYDNDICDKQYDNLKYGSVHDLN